MFLTSEVLEAVRGKKAWRSGIFWKKFLIRIVQQPQKPLSAYDQIWPMTSDEEDTRPTTSAYTAAAAGKSSRILEDLDF